MGKHYIIDGDNIIEPTDYEGKYNEVVAKLDELFADITEETTTQTNMYGTPYKVQFRKNELLPKLSPMQVTAKLNECLRLYRPLSLAEVHTFSADDLQNAFVWFMRLTSYINQYLTFVTDKQMFCAFLGTTVAVYNDLLGEPAYAEVLGGVEDYLISLNFTASQSGLTDSKMTMAKLQTNSQGHGLTKQMDSLPNVTINLLDKGKVNERLAKFKALTGGGNNGGKKK